MLHDNVMMLYQRNAIGLLIEHHRELFDLLGVLTLHQIILKLEEESPVSKDAD